MSTKDLEEELRELAARYRVMIDHAPEAVVLFDLDDGKFVEANAQACRLFGMPREQLLEQGPVTMSPERQPDGQLSAVAAPTLIQRAMSGEIPSFEWTHLDADGKAMLCRVQLVRVPAEKERLVRASVIDISERKESDKARARFEAILDATPDIVGIADADSRIQYLNPAGRALLGIAPDEELGRYTMADFLSEKSRRIIAEKAAATAAEKGVWRGETEFCSRDGYVFPTSQVVIAHRDHHGNVEYLSTIARDISARRAAELLERKVLHAQKLESLGVLAGGIAHDFNNILVGVLANTSIALKRLGDADPEARRLLREVRSSASRAADLARQLLDYAGKSQAHKTKIRLADVAGDVKDLVAASISKSARLQFDFAADVPPIVGDGTQLRQVLMNLIINASDALGSKPGDIDVRTRLAPLDPSRLAVNHLPPTPGSDGYVMLEVFDTGTGIDAPLDRIFDPFFTTKVAGRGLGLAAVMGIVKGHEGAIEVETSPTGTAFRLWFAPASAVRAAAAGPPDATTPRPFSARGAVLVIDDEDLVRRALRAVLEDLGFDVVEAADGYRAEAAYRERASELAAVMLDLTMPGLSGHEVLARLRAIDPSVPIVLTSGFSESVDASRADGFLAKPFTLEQVAETLRGILA